MQSTQQSWTKHLYGSGTVVVSADVVGKPHIHVGHLAADNEGEHGRYQVADELETWLNGGDAPWWLGLCRRVDPDNILLPHGCHLTMTGPMIMVPPGSFNWINSTSLEDLALRKRMADDIMNGTRPTL